MLIEFSNKTVVFKIILETLGKEELLTKLSQLFVTKTITLTQIDYDDDELLPVLKERNSTTVSHTKTKQTHSVS